VEWELGATLAVPPRITVDDAASTTMPAAFPESLHRGSVRSPSLNRYENMSQTTPLALASMRGLNTPYHELEHPISLLRRARSPRRDNAPVCAVVIPHHGRDQLPCGLPNPSQEETLSIWLISICVHAIQSVAAHISALCAWWMRYSYRFMFPR
jgi:hypothetical protein